jgi:hypothetical protein
MRRRRAGQGEGRDPLPTRARAVEDPPTQRRAPPPRHRELLAAEAPGAEGRRHGAPPGAHALAGNSHKQISEVRAATAPEDEARGRARGAGKERQGGGAESEGAAEGCRACESDVADVASGPALGERRRAYLGETDARRAAVVVGRVLLGWVAGVGFLVVGVVCGWAVVELS